jgi:hypothetical protein
MVSCDPTCTQGKASRVQLYSQPGSDSAQQCRVRLELNLALMVLTTVVAVPLVMLTRSGPSVCTAKH